MRIRTRRNGSALTPDARARFERRLRLALGRYAATLSAVELGVDVRTPEQPSARCSIRAEFPGGDSLEVEESGEDFEAASIQAIWKLGHSLARHRAGNHGETC